MPFQFRPCVLTVVVEAIVKGNDQAAFVLRCLMLPRGLLQTDNAPPVSRNPVKLFPETVGSHRVFVHKRPVERPYSMVQKDRIPTQAVFFRNTVIA